MHFTRQCARTGAQIRVRYRFRRFDWLFSGINLGLARSRMFFVKNELSLRTCKPIISRNTENTFSARECLLSRAKNGH